MKTVKLFEKKREDWDKPKKIYVGIFHKGVKGVVHAKVVKSNVYWYYKDRQGDYLKVKEKARQLSSNKSKVDFVWKSVDSSLCDQDKTHVIRVMENRYKKHIQNEIDRHQEYIDSEQQRIEEQKKYTQNRKEILKSYESLLKENKVSKQDYHWEVRWDSDSDEVKITTRELEVEVSYVLKETLYI